MSTLFVVLICIAFSAALIGDAGILEAIRRHGCHVVCAVVGTAVIGGSTLLDVDVAKPPTDNALRIPVQIHEVRPVL